MNAFNKLSVIAGLWIFVAVHLPSAIAQEQIASPSDVRAPREATSASRNTIVRFTKGGQANDEGNGAYLNLAQAPAPPRPAQRPNDELFRDPTRTTPQAEARLNPTALAFTPAMMKFRGRVAKERGPIMAVVDVGGSFHIISEGSTIDMGNTTLKVSKLTATDLEVEWVEMQRVFRLQ